MVRIRKSCLAGLGDGDLDVAVGGARVCHRPRANCHHQRLVPSPNPMHDTHGPRLHGAMAQVSALVPSVGFAACLRSIEARCRAEKFPAQAPSPVLVRLQTGDRPHTAAEHAQPPRQIVTAPGAGVCYPEMLRALCEARLVRSVSRCVGIGGCRGSAVAAWLRDRLHPFCPGCRL